MSKRICAKKCSLLHCGKSYKSFPAVKIFKFPPYDTVMGKVWRQICNFDEGQENLFLCSDHFADEFIGKRKLKQDAIPTNLLNTEENNSEVGLIFDSPSKKRRISNESLIDSCSFCLKNQKNSDFYRLKYEKCRQKINKLSILIKTIRKKKLNLYNSHLKIKKNKLYKKKEESLRDKIKNLEISENAKIFCHLLLKLRKDRKYSDEEKTLCQNIFYRSHSIYKFLRDGLKLNLPHSSFLYQWAPLTRMQPGIENSGIFFLQKKCMEMSDRSRLIVLVFDEIMIRRELTYNNQIDLIDGLEDVGLYRKPLPGKQVCVFMIRGLFDNWKSVLNYFVTENGIKGSLLKELIENNLKMLHEIGFKVKAIVCDQGSNNRKCYSELGTSPNKPYFMRNNERIMAIFDFPHLIKSIRNIWLSRNLNTADGIVSFDVIKELYEIEKIKITKMCPKLTENHIAPNSFQKMKVRYATQIFSKSVAAGIETIAEIGKFKRNSNEIAISTAKFIRKMDTIFDCLNSGTIFDKNKFRSGLTFPSYPSYSSVWEILCQELNHLDGPARTSKQWQENLKAWEYNLKSWKRKLIVEADATGGGEPPKKMSKFEERALTVFGVASVVGF